MDVAVKPAHVKQNKKFGCGRSLNYLKIKVANSIVILYHAQGKKGYGKGLQGLTRRETAAREREV